MKSINQNERHELDLTNLGVDPTQHDMVCVVVLAIFFLTSLTFLLTAARFSQSERRKRKEENVFNQSEPWKQDSSYPKKTKIYENRPVFKFSKFALTYPFDLDLV